MSLNLIDQAAQRKRIDDLLANPVESAKELESLRQQLTAAETRTDEAKQQRDVERVSYLNEFEKNQVLIKQLAAARAAIKVLRDIAEQSRGSVKADLNRYEQLLLIKQKVGVEKTAQYIAMDIEANRLLRLLDCIDEAPAAQPDDSALKTWLGEPVGEVKKYTGSLKDMAIIVWTGEQPEEGTLLYAPKGMSK